MDNVVKLRKDLLQKTNVKTSLNDYLIKAVALALRVSFTNKEVFRYLLINNNLLDGAGIELKHSRFK